MRKELLSRREFLKSSAAGLGGFIYLSANEKKEEAGKKEKKVIYRTLGKTKIRLPVVSMGVMNSDNPSLIRAALDGGIVHLDTAWYYGRGRNEEVIGQIIKERPRDSYVIGTKVVLPRDTAWGKYAKKEATQALFLERFHESLKRLKLEYVDILYHHDTTNQGMALYEPVLKALAKVKKEGKARFVGISTHVNEPEVIKASIKSKIYEVILTSYNYKQRHYLEMRETIAKAAEAGLGVVAMKTMAGGMGGYLGGKIPVAAAALKWVLQDPNVATTIPGFTTFDQMEMDLSVMEDISLTENEKELLKTASNAPGLYCQGCGQCAKDCIAKLPIPELMRAYMYTYGYRNLRLAHDLVTSLGLPTNICQECGQCPVKCSVGFDIPTKIRNVARLRDVPSEFLV
jgi:predicted aldo/keto reductase-like oxidoreductase